MSAVIDQTIIDAYKSMKDNKTLTPEELDNKIVFQGDKFKQETDKIMDAYNQVRKAQK